MKIGYIVSLKQPGLHAWVYREMISLERRGFKISIFPTNNYVGPYMPKPKWFTAHWTVFGLFLAQLQWLILHPVRYAKILKIALYYKAPLEFMLAVYFVKYMNNQRVDRIHCHFGDRKLYVGYFCHIITLLPLSVTIHAHELYNNINWKLFPVALNVCDNIICIAELNKNILTQKWNINKSKVHVVRLFGFIDDDIQTPTIILCVGRFETKKGHDILLEAVHRLIIEGLSIEVWLAGSPTPGEKGIDVVGYAKKLGLEKNIISFGEVGEKIIRVLYRECDLVCLLSRHDEAGVPEGVPVALIEAMSMGKPVVATSTGATHELVKEILIDEEDIDAATEAIRRLITNPALHKEMGERNRRIIQDSYSENNIDKLFNILSKI